VVCADEKENYNVGETIIQNYINEFVKKQDEFIMDLLSKQPGFVSLEESKHLIEIRNIVQRGEHLGADYVFNGKVFLTIYPTKIKEDQGKFTCSFNYRTQ